MIKGSRLPSFEEKNPIKDSDEICSSIHKNKTHNSILMTRCNSLDTYNFRSWRASPRRVHMRQMKTSCAQLRLPRAGTVS